MNCSKTVDQFVTKIFVFITRCKIVAKVMLVELCVNQRKKTCIAGFSYHISVQSWNDELQTVLFLCMHQEFSQRGTLSTTTRCLKMNKNVSRISFSPLHFVSKSGNRYNPNLAAQKAQTFNREHSSHECTFYTRKDCFSEC